MPGDQFVRFGAAGNEKDGLRFGDSDGLRDLVTSEFERFPGRGSARMCARRVPNLGSHGFRHRLDDDRQRSRGRIRGVISGSRSV
jgi:hypothetical protein